MARTTRDGGEKTAVVLRGGSGDYGRAALLGMVHLLVVEDGGVSGDVAKRDADVPLDGLDEPAPVDRQMWRTAGAQPVRVARD